MIKSKGKNIETRGFSFAAFVFKQPFQRNMLIISLVLIVAEFISFKYLYPFANFMADSYDYLDAALTNDFIAMRPIGYSWFLRAFSMIARSDTSMVFFQYMLLSVCCLFLLFTLMYLLRIGRASAIILLSFILLNPAWILVSNYVGADALFTALSICWLSVLLWILYCPHNHLLWMQAFLLVLLLLIRFNALYYPLVSVGAILLSRYKWRPKIIGALISVVPMLLLIQFTGNRYKEITGRWQMSAFGGWQVASNAIYTYRHVANDSIIVPAKFIPLHQQVKDHITYLKRRQREKGIAIDMAYFMWEGPLPAYLKSSTKGDSTSNEFRKYAQISLLYGEYGKFLISKYPYDYAKYYLLWNTKRYFSPPQEIMGYYNVRKDTLRAAAVKWFDFKDNKVRYYTNNITALKYYQIFFSGINLMFVLGMIGVVLFGGLKDEVLRKVVFLISALWLMNFGFSVLASPVVLRYQLFSSLFILAFILVAGEYLGRIVSQMDLKEKEPADIKAV